MEVLSAVAHLPQYRVLDTGSLEKSHAALCEEICPHGLTPLQGARLRTLHSRVRLRASSLHYVRYGIPVRVENARIAESYLVILPCAGTSALRFNTTEITLKQECGVVIAPGSRFEIEGDADAECLIWRVQADALDRLSASSFPEPGVLACALPLTEGVGARFLRAMRFVLSEMTYQDGLAGEEALHEKLEELLLFALKGASVGHRGQIAVLPGCVKRVEAFIAENAGEELSFPDLVAVSGVSARTLSRAFRLFRGKSPMTHLRHVRLQRVRADLMNACMDDCVTGILSRWGITQFGRFAAEYRRVYGEQPSATLRIARNNNH